MIPRNSSAHKYIFRFNKARTGAGEQAGDSRISIAKGVVCATDVVLKEDTTTTSSL